MASRRSLIAKVTTQGPCGMRMLDGPQARERVQAVACEHVVHRRSGTTVHKIFPAPDIALTDVLDHFARAARASFGDHSFACARYNALPALCSVSSTGQDETRELVT